MPFNLPTAAKGAGAPDVDDGLAVARFDDLRLIEHPDWAGTDNYGKPDDGSRYHFQFTIMSEDGSEVVYATVKGEPTGEPLELEAMVRAAQGGGLSSDERSNAFKIMSGLLTKAEFEAWAEADESNQFDGSALPGRLVHVKIGHNKKGWPQVEQVISIFKKK